MTTKYYLPSKISSYLKRLLGEYILEEKTNLIEIISSAKIYIIEGTGFDNWNGGTYGHDVKLFLSESVLARIKVREQNTIAEEIRTDLNICAEAIENEFFRKVIFELNNENDLEYKQANALSKRPELNPSHLSIWTPNQIRLFISHRDNHKVAANLLAEQLKEYGISAFVAHDSIEPMKTWRQEILNGLETMEIMLAFITDNFHESTWTNQEIGYALGKNIPIISLKLERSDPEGFINDIQALKSNLDTPTLATKDIYKLISERLGNDKRTQSALISAFIKSDDYNQAKKRFNRLSEVAKILSEEEVEKLIEGYRTNNQLHQCIYLNNQYQRLKHFLEQTTDKKFSINNQVISVQEIPSDIPF